MEECQRESLIDSANKLLYYITELLHKRNRIMNIEETLRLQSSINNFQCTLFHIIVISIKCNMTKSPAYRTNRMTTSSQ